MSRFTTCGLTILLAFAPAALAVDGTVLINQSTITNGLTGCPNGGHFPIVICQSGSYRLSGNLTVPDENTDAILINADNVTLDLNGFALLGPVVCNLGTFPVQCSATGHGNGILAPPFRSANVTVSNGVITGFGSSGLTLTARGVRIDGLRVTSNAGDGMFISNAIVTNCSITGNAGDGIHFDNGPGTVDRNTISFNGGFGIGEIAPDVVASNNSVVSNGQDGLNSVGLAVNNIIANNIGFGLSCGDKTCSFEGNAFLFNKAGVAQNGTSLGHNSSNNSGSVF